MEVAAAAELFKLFQCLNRHVSHLWVENAPILRRHGEGRQGCPLISLGVQSMETCLGARAF